MVNTIPDGPRLGRLRGQVDDMRTLLASYLASTERIGEELGDRALLALADPLRHALDGLEPVYDSLQSAIFIANVRTQPREIPSYFEVRRGETVEIGGDERLAVLAELRRRVEQDGPDPWLEARLTQSSANGGIARVVARGAHLLEMTEAPQADTPNIDNLTQEQLIAALARRWGRDLEADLEGVSRPRPAFTIAAEAKRRLDERINRITSAEWVRLYGAHPAFTTDERATQEALASAIADVLVQGRRH